MAADVRVRVEGPRAMTPAQRQRLIERVVAEVPGPPMSEDDAYLWGHHAAPRMVDAVLDELERMGVKVS